MALCIQTGKPLLDCLDFFQLFVPPPLQLAGCKPIASIHRVVLLEGLLCLIRQLLQLAGLRSPTNERSNASYRCAGENWVIYTKEPFAGPQQVLRYLSRYTHRVAISNRR